MDSTGKLYGWHNYLFIGTHGHVAAVRKNNGRKVWDTSLPMTGYSVVSILIEDDKVFCASGGRVFALDPATGDILWKNGLKGMGTGLVYLTTANSNDTEGIMSLLAHTVQQQKRRRAAGSGGAGSGN
jgi:outer membrane protein assembly factor BamB